MKKLFILASLLAVSVLATDANRMFYVNMLSADVDATGTGTDVAAYKGNGTVAVAWGTASDASYTGTVTVAHCATIDGTYTPVTNLAGTVGAMTNVGVTTNEMDTFAIDLGAVHKYLQVSVSHLNVSNNVSAVLVSPMKSQ